MEASWIFPELMIIRNMIKRIIPHAVEHAKGNPHWDNVADDLIDAQLKIEYAIKVKQRCCA